MSEISRRCLLLTSAVATTALVIPTAAALASEEPDPIFAAIESELREGSHHRPAAQQSTDVRLGKAGPASEAPTRKEGHSPKSTQ